MDICSSCTRGGNERVTFIMEKCFISDCVDYLLNEANISSQPKLENGLLIYSMSHQCGFIQPPNTPAPKPPASLPPASLPPPYYPRNKDRSVTFAPQNEDHSMTFAPQNNGWSLSLPRNQGGHLDGSVEHENSMYVPMKLRAKTLERLEPAYPRHLRNMSVDSRSSSVSETSTTESLFLADGSLSITTHSKRGVADPWKYLPPRNIPRLNYESSIPALAQPYLKYQPHMYQQGMKRFETPYQVSSRIIITDSGEVQFERNVMGNVPTSDHTGFVFKKQLPLPPRGLRAATINSPAASRELNGSMKSGVLLPVSCTTLETCSDVNRLFDTSSRRFTPKTTPPEVPPRPSFHINQERFISPIRLGQGSIRTRVSLRNRLNWSTGQFL